MLRVAENLTPPSFQSNPQKFQQRVNAAPSERILVVEDDHAVQKALRRLFEAEGYAVQIASDGNAAVESCTTGTPSTVVLALRLPGSSGREVCREGKALALTAQEFKTLKFMVQNPERVITRDELLNEVWGYHNYPSTRTVDNHILKLRQKLEKDPANPVHFRTIHGVGYKFVA